MRVPSFEDFIGLLTIEDIDKLTRLVSEHITDNETKKEYEPLISKLKRSRAELAEILQE
jgi:tetrahydromethanopterin S-methyltransferase subunit A